MTKNLVLLVLFLASSVRAGNSQFLLTYMADEGCQPNVIYPEGGCPRRYERIAEQFETAQAAIDRINQLEARSGLPNISWDIGIPSSFPDYKLYRVIEEPIKKVKIGERKTTEMRPIEVLKDETKWVLGK